MVAKEKSLLRASQRAIAGWDHKHGSFGNPTLWDAAMQDLMHLVDEYDDQGLSSSDARLLDVARNAVDSWVDRKKRRKKDKNHDNYAMQDLENLVKAIDKPAWRRSLRAFMPTVTFLAGMVTGAIVYWFLTV